MSRHLLEAIKAVGRAALQVVTPFAVTEHVRAPRATFHAEHWRAKPGHESAVQAAQRRIESLARDGRKEEADHARRDMLASHMQMLWAGQQNNLVVTQGLNDLLDRYFSGSSYTAAWFLGLISSVSFSAIAAGDTMASHAGWTEAGPTNAPNYSAGTRPAISFSAASAGSKASSAAGTVRGCFTTSNSTKDGTTGTLYNAVLFTGGDRVVAASDVVNVSLTYTA
jgi:hypothetical protein